MLKTYHYGKNNENEAGFTLIELLVVILIIGLLAAIAIPMYLNQKKTAEDAALKSDLKNIATAYQTWRVTPTNTNAKFRQLVGNRSSAFVGDPTTQRTIAAGTYIEWKNIPEFPAAKVSPDDLAEVVVIAAPTVRWHTLYDEGEVCIAITNPNSSYNRTTDNSPASYDGMLYYDQRLGGVKTMDDIAKALTSGKGASCYGFAESWMTAVGYTGP